MKPKNHFLPALGLILLASGITLYTFLQRGRPPAQTYPATIRHDCAPWDGSAFTVQIPWQQGMVIDISIWRSPQFDLPMIFFFPDPSGQVGNAILIPPAGLPEPLSGKVSFSGVQPYARVDGMFNLNNEEGNRFVGKFSAKWSDMAALCG